MADSKKYDGSQWEHSLRKLTTATEAVENPLYSDGTAITSYTIKGDTVQNGTPTSSNPVDVNGVGELVVSDYQIPISSGGVTTNIDLGSTQTIRQVKKLVLTGDEYWVYQANNLRFVMTINNIVVSGLRATPFFCTHYIPISDGRPIEDVPLNASYLAAVEPNIATLNIKIDTYTTAADFKAYLQQQYANGTPVVIWYILPTPETATVNEPLMKIGDYADTLSNATAIPTTEGANSITVDTTVQPSEFTATWTGWHDADVKEKSENLFDYQTMASGAPNRYLNADGSLTENNGWSTTDYIPVSGTKFTLKRTATGNSPAICLYDSDKQYITGLSYNGNSTVTITGETLAHYARFSYQTFSGSTENLSQTMLNTGSTALPYEPYWE